MDIKLIILVLVLRATIGEFEENFAHTQLNKNPGVIFEKIADAHLYNSFIELYTRIDLRKIEEVRGFLIINQREKFDENHKKGSTYLMPFFTPNGWYDWIVPNSRQISQATLEHYLANKTSSNQNLEALQLENTISTDLTPLLKTIRNDKTPTNYTLKAMETRYENLITKMSSILNLAQIDKIDSQLFTKGYLNSIYEEISKTKNYVFPKLENEEGVINCRHIYQITLLHKNESLIISIRLPKIGKEGYSIYKQYAVTSFVNLDLTIASTFRIYHDYFVRDRTGTKIFFMNETQFNNQEQCNNHYYLKNLVFFPQTCESKLFDNSDDSSCTTREVIDSEPQVLKTNQGLIYSTPYHTQARIQCTKFQKDLKLIKIGIIEIGPNCKFIFQGKAYPGTAWQKSEIVIPHNDLQVGDLERFLVKENFNIVTTTQITPRATIKSETKVSGFLLATSLVLTIINLAILIGQYCASKSISTKPKVEALI